MISFSTGLVQRNVIVLSDPVKEAIGFSDLETLAHQEHAGKVLWETEKLVVETLKVSGSVMVTWLDYSKFSHTLCFPFDIGLGHYGKIIP